MSHTRAVVTLTVGNRYRALWERVCRANWQEYAMRHDADLFAFSEPLDTGPRAAGRPPTWQKLLVPGQPQLASYKQVVWLDADILIHPRAPWIGEGVPGTLVGAVDEYSYPTPELNLRAFKRLYELWELNGVPYANNPTAREFYRVGGFPREFDRAVQAGVLVLSPEHHREISEYVYNHYTQTKLAGLAGEMRPLSFELLSANLVHWLAPEWNANWVIEKQLYAPFLLANGQHPLWRRAATRALAHNFILHFGGSSAEMKPLDLSVPELAVDPQPRVYTKPAATAQPSRTPVVLFIYNRPETTAEVMRAIRAARPPALYVVADGARPSHPGDDARYQAARQIALQVDWECRVETNFAEANMGLKRRVESGLDWVFEQVSEAVILEDDCVPDPTFFQFCDELLELYRDDERVMTISGSDFKFGMSNDPYSYTFSRYPLIWGWATWRRAWIKNDPHMTTLPEAIRSGRLEAMLGDRHAAQYWAYVLNDNLQTSSSWDYAWLWSIWEHNGLCIHPNTNLVENIGFGADATHTHDAKSLLANMLCVPLEASLRHPPCVERNADADVLVDDIAFSGSVRRLWNVLQTRRAAVARLTANPAGAVR